MMKKIEHLFQEMDCARAYWIVDSDKEYLPQVAGFAVEQDFSILSVPSNFIKEIWPWIENKHIKIIDRFDFAITADVDSAISEFALHTSGGFRDGADGIQVGVPVKSLTGFVTALKPLRDDLFFDRFFSIVLNIEQIKVDMWDSIFVTLRAVHPNAVLITSDGDDFDRSSDFVGRIFTMLEKWDSDADLHLMFGKNTMKVIQTIRLVQKMRPDLMKKLTVFVRN